MYIFIFVYILIIVTIYGIRILLHHWSAAEVVEFQPAIWHLNPRIKWLGRSMTWRATSSVLSRCFFCIFHHGEAVVPTSKSRYLQWWPMINSHVLNISFFLCFRCHLNARLTKCVKTAISSKQLGCEGPLAKLVAEACVQVMPPTPSKFDVDNVRVTKAGFSMSTMMLHAWIWYNLTCMYQSIITIKCSGNHV